MNHVPLKPKPEKTFYIDHDRSWQMKLTCVTDIPTFSGPMVHHSFQPKNCVGFISQCFVSSKCYFRGWPWGNVISGLWCDMNIGITVVSVPDQVSSDGDSWYRLSDQYSLRIHTWYYQRFLTVPLVYLILNIQVLYNCFGLITHDSYVHIHDLNVRRKQESFESWPVGLLYRGRWGLIVSWRYLSDCLCYNHTLSRLWVWP